MQTYLRRSAFARENDVGVAIARFMRAYMCKECFIADTSECFHVQAYMHTCARRLEILGVFIR